MLLCRCRSCQIHQTRKILLFIMYVVFLKKTTFLWRISILHPSHTSLFFETVFLSFKNIFSYFSNHTHRTKIKESFTNRLKTEYGVPQGSILGPLLFNINSIDIFYEYEDSDIENYADDTAPYAFASDINTIVSELQITASKLSTLLNSNHMKANPEKSHLLLCFKSPKRAYFFGALVELRSTEKFTWNSDWF